MSVVTTLQGLLPLVVPGAPGAGEAEVLAELRAGAREFCRRTGLWNTTCSGVDLVADQAEYVLSLPSGADATFFTEARLNGATAGSGTYRMTISSGGFALEFLDAYIPTANETDALEVDVELQPSLHSDVVSVEVLTAHPEAIVAYAIWKLTGNPRRPSFNLAESERAHEAWVAGVSNGLYARASGRQRGTLKVHLPAGERWFR